MPEADILPQRKESAKLLLSLTSELADLLDFSTSRLPRVMKLRAETIVHTHASRDRRKGLAMIEEATKHLAARSQLWGSEHPDADIDRIRYILDLIPVAVNGIRQVATV